MPRTDKEIAEYVRYYAKNNQRKWAVEMMTKTEGKTAEEIEHICKVENGKVRTQAMLQKKPPKYSDEFLDGIAADRGAGMSYKDIADKYKMPVKTINSIMAVISHRKKKAVEAEMKQQEQAVKEQPRDAISREPEAYSGQIYDDEPEPIVESDVKIFIPGELPTDEVIELDVPEPEKIPYKKPEIIEPPAARACTTDDSNTIRPTLPPQNVWLAIRDELRDFARGLFGAGAEIVEESVSAKYHDVSITVKTADGDHICFNVGKEKGKIVEEDE